MEQSQKPRSKPETCEFLAHYERSEGDPVFVCLRCEKLSRDPVGAVRICTP